MEHAVHQVRGPRREPVRGRGAFAPPEVQHQCCEVEFGLAGGEATAREATEAGAVLEVTVDWLHGGGASFVECCTVDGGQAMGHAGAASASDGSKPRSSPSRGRSRELPVAMSRSGPGAVRFSLVQ